MGVGVRTVKILLDGIEVSEADNLQIIEGKMDLGCIMLGKMVKSLPNHIQRWILDELRHKYEKSETIKLIEDVGKCVLT